MKKKEDHSTCLVWRVYGLDVLDEAVRDGEAKNAPDRHAPGAGSGHLFISFENGSIQGERNGSNYSGVFFGRTLSRDAVDRARREEINIAIAVK